MVIRTGTDKGHRGTRRKLDVDRPVLCIGMLIGTRTNPRPVGAYTSLLLKCAPEYSTPKAVKVLKRHTEGHTEAQRSYLQNIANLEARLPYAVGDRIEPYGQRLAVSSHPAALAGWGV